MCVESKWTVMALDSKQVTVLVRGQRHASLNKGSKQQGQKNSLWSCLLR